MDFQEFSSTHFEEYRSWFKDKELNRWLGPKPDEDWLEYVLKDQNGRQYSIFKDGKMVSVVGFVFPTNAHPYYVITDIAICPELKGRGIGKAVVYHLLQLYRQYVFKTFVEAENLKAIAFFEHLGWEKAEVVDEDGMWAFIYDASDIPSVVN